jgi:hypothetical protein
MLTESFNRAFGVGSGFGMDNRRVRVLVSFKSGIYNYPYCPERLREIAA